MLKLKNKTTFENNLWLAEIDASHFNLSKENRIKAVTDIASITKGKLGYNYNLERRKKLYQRLLTESAGKPSAPFEFISVKRYRYDIESKNEEIDFAFLKYSFYNQNTQEIFTNYRNCLINGIKFDYWDTWLNDKHQLKDFKIIVGYIPMKVINHLVRHRTFSFLVESSRNKRYLKKVRFWYPSWWNDKLRYYIEQYDINNTIRLKRYVDAKGLKPEEATMELSDRRLVHFAMAAWLQDENAWENLFKVRDNNTGTMSITNIVVNNIKKIIKNEQEN